MKIVEFRITGTAPLLFNREPQAFEDAPDSRPRRSKDDKPLEEAQRHLHTTGNGNGRTAVVPAHMLLKSLQHVTTIALGRSRTISLQQVVKGGLVIEPASLKIEPQDWTLDVRRAGNPRKGPGAGPLMYRPRFDSWSVAGEAHYDDRFLAGEQVRSLFDEAGRYDGLGSYRVGNGGPFGRFIVTEWKE